MEYTEGAMPARSGTPALHEATLLFDEVSQATIDMILPLVNRPNLSGPEETFITSDDNFRFHYTLSGGDAVSEAYAQEMAEYFVIARADECGDMGYITPPSDNGVGGCNRYDVYLVTLGGSTLGYCSSGGEYKPPDSTQNCSASHIVMNTNLATTTSPPHPPTSSQHAIQMSYDYTSPPGPGELRRMDGDQIWPM